MREPKLTEPSLKPILILEALSQQDSFVGIHEICAQTGLAQSTVHRQLTELVRAGYAERSGRLRKYRLGMEAIAASSRFWHANRLTICARDEMRRLTLETGEATRLVTLSGEDAILLWETGGVGDGADGDGALPDADVRCLVHCTACGKVLAAHMPPAWLDAFLARGRLRRFTPYTITIPDSFRRELLLVRRQGWALNNLEGSDSVRGIAVPVYRGASKVVASLGILAPKDRLSRERAQSLLPRLTEASRLITLGMTDRAWSARGGA